MTDEQKPESRRKSRKTRDKCNGCGGDIEWIRDTQDRYIPAIPGTDIRHRCVTNYQSKTTEREGYL